jgi:hypothetical protein
VDGNTKTLKLTRDECPGMLCIYTARFSKLV